MASCAEGQGLIEAYVGLFRVMPVFTFVFLVALAFYIGLYPKPLFDMLERPVAQVVERVNPCYYEDHGIPHPLLQAEMKGKQQAA